MGLTETVWAPIRFFLYGYTAQGMMGFHHSVSREDGQIRCYILKGGYQAEKQRLLRRINDTLQEKGQSAQAMVCACDPSVLDGILVEERHVLLLDATALQSSGLKYRDVSKNLVHVGSCAPIEKLPERFGEIVAATTEYFQAQQRACRCLQRAAQNKKSVIAAVQPFVREAQILRAADRIAAQEWEVGESAGQEKRRFLSAVTPNGILIFYNTLQALCPRMYVIEDSLGRVSSLFMERIRQLALQSGEEFFCCGCPLLPQGAPEHLLFPRLGVGFTVSNFWHKADFPVFRRLYAERFTDSEGMLSLENEIQSLQKDIRHSVQQATEETQRAYHTLCRLRDQTEYINGTRRTVPLLQRLLQELVLPKE